MKKVIFALAFVMLIMSVLSLTCFAAGQTKYVYDRAEIFDESEIEALEAEAKKYFGTSYASLYIVTDDSDYVSYYGEDFKREYNVSKDSIVFIITANSRHNYDLYTYGKCTAKISEYEVDFILDYDDVYGNIKNGRYYEGAFAFIELAFDSCKTNYASIVFWTVLISVLSGVGVGVGITVSYKRKSRSDKYPLSRYCKLDLTRDRDDFRGSFVTQRRINSGSGRGGRSGGGGGSGHRGGR